MRMRIDFTIVNQTKPQRYVLEDDYDCGKLQNELEEACKRQETVSFPDKYGKTITVNTTNVLSWTFVDVTNVQQHFSTY